MIATIIETNLADGSRNFWNFQKFHHFSLPHRRSSGFVTRSCPLRGAGTRDEPLRSKNLCVGGYHHFRLCCKEAGGGGGGGWGERKRKRAWHDGKLKERREAFSRLFLLPIVPRASEHSIFRLLLHVFIGIPSWKPVGAFGKEKALCMCKLTRTPHRLDHVSRNARFPRGHPSSETQGQLVGTIDCLWWQFTISGKFL